MAKKTLDTSNEKKAGLERAVIVGIIQGSRASEIEEEERSLDELAELAAAAGAKVVGRLSQRRQSPDPAWLIGKGKIGALQETCAALEADTVIFDSELTGSQIRNIEQSTGCKVIDRTFLILDIFAKIGRASCRERV